MISALEILESLGPGVTRVVNAGVPTDASNVYVVGEADSPPDGAIVVHVSPVADQSRTLELLAEARAAGAAAAILRPPILVTAENLKGDLTVAELDPRMSVSHFVSLLHTMLNRADRHFADSATVQQDLFGLADAVGSMLGASVTIEDARSRVVAYSSSHGETDAARTSTIMGRVVPADVASRLRASGVLRRLTTAERAFIVPAAEPDFRQRLVVPVKVGSETIGSIWAIWEGELTDVLSSELERASAAVAVQLVQLRAHADQLARYSIDKVRQALRVGTGELHDGGLTLPHSSSRVVALEPLGSTTAFEDLSVWRTYLQRHAWADPILADLDGAAFAIVGDQDGAGHWSWLKALAGTSPLGRVAASRAFRDPIELSKRRTEASDVLSMGRSIDRLASSYDEVWAAIVLRRASAALSPEDFGEVAELLSYDARHGAELASTTAAWLESGGDVTAVASSLHVHANTVRHRLKRARQLLPGVDFGRPDQRMATALLLRLNVAKAD